MDNEATDKTTSFESHWYTPDDPRYTAELAGFQTAYGHRPDVVVAARHAEDVRAAVEYAARHRLPVAVQSTGHGLSVPADRGVLVTTRRLDTIDIDPERRVARVGAGVRAGDLVTATAEHGLAPLNGSSPTVGVVGYLLGGGVGLMVREFGYAADHVTAVDLVTADGRRRTLRPGDELFAAVLGSGGNFGVVTGVEVQLVPVARIFGGQMMFDTPLVPAVVRAWRAWTHTVPDTLTSSLAMVRLPDLPVLPPHLRGHFVASIRIVSTSSAEESERLVAPLRAVGTPLTDDLRDMPYTESYTVHRDPEDPHAYAATNALLADLPEEATDGLLAALGPEPTVVTDIRHLGGATHTTTSDNVIEHRDARYAVRLIGEGTDTMEPADFKRPLDALAPWTVGRHLNFVYGAAAAAGDEQTASGYSADTYARLTRLKQRYDPANMFRFNRNIRPAG
ncbi:FAD-binding oxidoreductase [Streptomyces sp. NPDC051684]|uniref:FAD-binding oxidoreductase n=1 Tax=Streptomyces sp. NPDC051684 TaxID=3365670 RepID=UPI0037A75EEE